MKTDFTPKTLQQWAATIFTILATAGGAISGAVTWAKSEGIWGGKIEKANMILAEMHIGEEPVRTTVVLEDEDDYQAVINFENGDTLFYWKYKDPDGDRQKIKRWTSKKSLDEIIAMAAVYPAFSIVGRAYADASPVRPVMYDEDEVFIGWTADGHAVYYIKSHDECDIVNEGTGEILEHLPKPCEQYVVPRQKKG